MNDGASHPGDQGDLWLPEDALPRTGEEAGPEMHGVRRGEPESVALDLDAPKDEVSLLTESQVSGGFPDAGSRRSRGQYSSKSVAPLS